MEKHSSAMGRMEADGIDGSNRGMVDTVLEKHHSDFLHLKDVYTQNYDNESERPNDKKALSKLNSH